MTLISKIYLPSLYEDILRNRVWIRRRRRLAGVNKHNQVRLMRLDCDLKEQTILQTDCDWIIIIPIRGKIVSCLEHIHCKGKVAISTCVWKDSHRRILLSAWPKRLGFSCYFLLPPLLPLFPPPPFIFSTLSLLPCSRQLKRMCTNGM